MRPLRIGTRQIGPGHPCYIIAELSCNHEGSLAEAELLVEAAAECGVDAVKIQTYTADTITRDFQYRPKGTMWENLDLYALYQKAYTPWEWHESLFTKARALGLDFFSSPFDETAVDFLVSLGVPVIKVASFEVVDLKLLEKIAATGLPVLMSSGMTEFPELQDAVRTLFDHGCSNLGLFQCNSGYPASFAEANLATIAAMKAIFDVPVGLSDHILFADIGQTQTVAHVSPVEAVRLGANLLEVHLTLDRVKAKELNDNNVGGFDWAFSRTPEELKRIVKMVRQFEESGEVLYETELERECAAKSLGQVCFSPTERELNSRKLRPSLWATRPIAKGEPFRFAAGTSEGNFDSLRPGEGLPIRFTDLVCSVTARTDISVGTPLAWEHLNLEMPDALKLRFAEAADAKEVWEINRHPSVRAASFNSSDISWEGHKAWFSQSLANPNRYLFVAEAEGELIAFVRLEKLEDGLGEISIAVSQGRRKRGVGQRTLRQASNRYFELAPDSRAIRAYIKKDNLASRRAFEKSGYLLSGELVVQGSPVWCYMLARSSKELAQ